MDEKPTDHKSLARRDVSRDRGDMRAYVGPKKQYDFMGATQFRLLTTLGLRQEHTLLDFGCGSLRAGRLFIQYLLPGRYFGIEPNRWLIEDAIKQEIGADLIAIKQPSFDYNDSFDFGAFKRTFDFIVAQSIFSHAGHDIVARSLTSARAVMKPQSAFLATFIHNENLPRSGEANSGWFYPGCLRYERSTVQRLVAEAGLICQELPWFHPRQTWYLLTLDETGLIDSNDLGCLSGQVLRDRQLLRQQSRGSKSSESVQSPVETDRRSRNQNRRRAAGNVDVDAGRGSLRTSLYRNRVFLREVVRSGQFSDHANWRFGEEQLAFLRKVGLKENFVIADIGCGPLRLGNLLIKFLEEGYYYGVDVNENTLQLGREVLMNLNVQQTNYALIATDCFNLDEVTRPLDMAFSNSLFSHLPEEDIRRCLTSVHRHLKQRTSYYSTFFMVGEDKRIEDPVEWQYRGRSIITYADRNPFHYRASALQMLAKSVGFEMEIVPAYHAVQTMGRFTKI